MRASWFAIGLMVAAVGCGDGEGSPDARPGDPDGGNSTDGGSGATLMIDRTTQDFGTQVTNAAGPAMTFTIGNTGTAPTGTLTVSIGGGNPGHFDITADSCTGVALASATGCEVSVAYAPTAAGSSAANLRIAGSPGGQVMASLTGTGVAPGALSIAPPTPNFGVVSLGVTSAATTLTVTNTGGTMTGALATALSGANMAEFAIGTNGCTGQTLAPSATCTVSVTMTPSSSGAKTASLTVSGSPGGAAVSTLSGTGLDPADITMSPASRNFGDTLVGASATQVFTVSNGGTQSTGQLGVGTIGAAFSVTADTCTGQVVASGMTCSVTVQYLATAGAATGSVNVGGMPGGAATSTLSGNGLTPATIEMSPDTHDYGNVVVGVGVNQSFTVTNTGTQPTGNLSVSRTGAAYTVTTDTCNNQVLAGNASCSVSVRFAPTGTGASTGSVTVAGTPGGSDTSTLSGNGLSPGAIGISPASHDYGDVVVGQQLSRLFIVTNSGQQATGFLSTSKTGIDFTVTSDTCHGKIVAGGATCELIVRFAPATAGAKQGSVSVSGTPGGATTATLTGNGLTPAVLAATPADYDFGSVVVGQNTSQSFTIINNGQQSTSALSASLPQNISASDFFITADTCSGQILTWGSSCSVTVRFGPYIEGPRSSRLTVSGTVGGDIQVDLMGNGLPSAILEITPGTHDYGTHYVYGPQFFGKADCCQEFVVTNTGTATSGTITMDASGSPDFYLYGDYCTGEVLAPGFSCSLYVEFYPETTGLHETTLSATANPGGTANAFLEGFGIDGKFGAVPTKKP